MWRKPDEGPQINEAGKFYCNTPKVLWQTAFQIAVASSV
jgi:hypothetical protein